MDMQEQLRKIENEEYWRKKRPEEERGIGGPPTLAVIIKRSRCVPGSV